MVEQPLLSIIITSYTLGRVKDILELLDSIKAQTYPDTEIVFVAERSEELYERVRAYASGEGTINMRVVYNGSDPGLSSSRNLGIKNAQGDIIGFIDDDALPFPDWAEEMVKTYENDSIVGVTGPAFPLWADESMSWFPEEFYWIIGCSAWCNLDEKTEVRNVWGMNMSFKREALNLAGIFSTSIGGIQGRRLHGEEDDLSLRIRRITKKSIVYNPKVRVKHRVYENRLTSRFIARNSYWIGFTRHMLKGFYHGEDGGKNLLDVEYRLLKRILIGLFPNILRTFFTKPVIAWRKLRVTMTALVFVAIGYYSHLFVGLLPGQKPAIH